MARKGDEGPYHPDNVFKQTCSENVREYWLSEPLKHCLNFKIFPGPFGRNRLRY